MSHVGRSQCLSVCWAQGWAVQKRVNRSICHLGLTHMAQDSLGGTVFASVCLCVCLFFRTISQKSNTARIAKLDTEMFQDQSWKLIYFGVKRSKIKVNESQKHCRRGSLHSCECWLLVPVYLDCIKENEGQIFRESSEHVYPQVKYRRGDDPIILGSQITRAFVMFLFLSLSKELRSGGGRSGTVGGRCSRCFLSFT